MHVLKRYYLKTKVTFEFIPNVLLIMSGVLYFIARLLPEPNLTKESVTLLQHFVGGGFVSTLYFFYIKTELKIRLPFLLQTIILYAVVSTLGVTNELLEFTSTKLHLYEVDGSDVWWDLAANTLGAFSLYFCIELVQKLTKTTDKR